MLATGLLIGFYFLLYKRNATYNHSRLYLLALPFVAVLVSWVTIEVHTPPVRTVVIETPPPAFAEKETGMSESKPLSGSLDKTEDDEKAMLRPTPSVLSGFNWKKGVLTGYITVAVLLLSHLLLGGIRILRLKKRGKRESYRGISVIRSDKIKTPFSFFKTIYLGTKLRDAQSHMVLAHERWHILHKHYIDVLCIECMTRVLWFNPLLWWVRHELRNLHEYQADRSVLDHGQDIYEYQTTLLEEVMNNSSCLANGFNHSFIKQRFIAMKHKPSIRFSTLRRITLLPFSVLLFVLFTFTEGEAKIIYIHKPAPLAQKPTKASFQAESPIQIEVEEERVLEEKKENERKETEEPPPAVMKEKTQENILTQPEVLPEAPVTPPKSLEEFPETNTTRVETWTRENNRELQEITNRPDYPQISNVSLSSVPFTSDIAECPIYIEKDDEKTLVTRVFPILSDWEQMSFPDKNKMMLIDSRTGDRYLLRDLQGGVSAGDSVLHSPAPESDGSIHVFISSPSFLSKNH